LKLAITVAAFLTVGCGSAPPNPDPDGGGAVVPVTLGTGEIEFESLANGDDIFVIQGPQLGYHLVGSVRVSGVNPGNPADLGDESNPTTTFRVYRDGTRIDANGARYVQGLRAVDGANQVEMIGRFVILDIQSDQELANVSLEFEVTVTDVDGNSGSDRLTLTGIPHPNNL
jgi:hypothetical protein